MKRFSVLLPVLFLWLGTLSCNVALARAEEDPGEEQGSRTGLPLPRYAALRFGQINLRSGPGTRYPIEWVFVKQGLPVQITAEYDIWRRIRDFEGTEGWVQKSALTGKRGAIVTGVSRDLRRNDSADSAITAHLEVGALGQILGCGKEWCKVKFDGIKGYLRKSEFWGAEDNETFH